MNNNKLTEVIIEKDTENSELHRKAAELDKDKINSKYDELLKRKEELERSQSIDLGQANPKKILERQEKNYDYLLRARDSKSFLTDDFNGKVPFFSKNIILLAAYSGDGKSTTCANLAYHAIHQTQKVLVITNEEIDTDVYNRVTCLCKGYSYTNHKNFSDDQISTFNDFIEILDGRLTVVDDNYNGGMGQTTTIEGIEALFYSLIEKKTHYDLIIIDYYQNVSRSTKNPHLNAYQVQEMFCKLVDRFKNIYNAPIVVLAQRMSNHATLSFKDSIEGRKMIYNVATCAIGMKAEREEFRTAFTFEKSRWAEAVGKTVYTGFNKGLYVDYDNKFQSSALAIKESKALQKIKGLSNVFKKGDKDDSENK